MNIKNLTNEQIELFAAYYISVTKHRGMSVKKVREWARFESKELFSLSDEEILAFLEKCHVKAEQLAEEKKRAFDASAEGLDEETKKLLTLVTKRDTEMRFSQEGDVLVAEIFSDVPVKCKIRFSGFSSTPKLTDCYLYSDNIRFEKRGSDYILEGEAMVWESGDTTPFSLSFKEAEAVITPYKAEYDGLLFLRTPWESLFATARGIYGKYELFGDICLNEKEKEMLPIIDELGELEFISKEEYPIFKELLAEHGHTKLLPLIRTMENTALSVKKNAAAEKKLMKALCGYECEELWRNLYDSIRETQKNYPSLIDEKKAEKTRKIITKELYSLGYGGEYPSFVKTDEAQSTAYHVYCAEWEDNESVDVRFLCGTERLKKGKAPSDIYACMFFEGDKRIFKSHDITKGEKGVSNEVAIKEACRIADKRARLKKLSKEERKSIVGGLNVDLKRYILFFLALGLLFGIGFTLLFMIFEIIDSGSFLVVYDVIWLETFALTSITFGLLFGTVLYGLMWLGSRK